MDPVRFQKKFRVFLKPFAVLYRLILGLRRRTWETGLRSRLIPSCPCVSVGNIAWGGTGKTPLTDWLMSWAEKRSINTVVLSRGYKADLSIAPVYVKPHHSAREVGDEPLMLGLDHPGSAVLVDPDRRRSGAYALKSLSPQLLLLDDGFQHLAVSRDLDLVLLRPKDLREEWGRVIPAGSWREGVSALKRAGVFLIKCDRLEMEDLLPTFKERLQVFQRPVFSFTLRPSRLEQLLGANREGGIGGREYALVTGVGNPQLVEETVELFMGRRPKTHLIYPDHYPFEFKDADKFNRLGIPVICTRKDAVKLRRLPLTELWSLRVEVCFGPALWSPRSFPEWLDAWWQRQNQALPLLATEKRWSGFSAETGLFGSAPPSPLPPMPPLSPLSPLPLSPLPSMPLDVAIPEGLSENTDASVPDTDSVSTASASTLQVPFVSPDAVSPTGQDASAGVVSTEDGLPVAPSALGADISGDSKPLP